MTLDEALTEAVCGARVRATNMQEGSYIDYNFNGWRINFAGGSSSGWTPRELDYASEWVEVPIEAPKPEPAPLKGGWGSLKPATSNTPEYIAAVDKLIGAKPAAPPIADVIELPGVVSRDQAEAQARAALPVWAPKKLDPNKGGW